MDIRKKTDITHSDVLTLGFIRCGDDCYFRKHHNQGLRSHVMEKLVSGDVETETAGVMRDGLLRFPRAIPRAMLRIFKNRFASLDEVFSEVSKIKILESYLPRDTYAKSSEFIVGYTSDNTPGAQIGLCGLQEYVDGAILDPWNLVVVEPIGNMDKFIDGLKKMAAVSFLLPDLAGIGNLKVDQAGNVRLVDINNISTIRFTPEIDLDDNGYPACDKSIEVLYRLEKKFIDPALRVQDDKIYSFFLHPERANKAGELEKQFYNRLKHKNI
ncbi:MAG: hypothetical protein HKM93_18905 [Desulfobacteraceae bacterium]|nr:hypothetical protein [Desulfobacteraceae bacterium]